LPSSARQTEAHSPEPNSGAASTTKADSTEQQAGSWSAVFKEAIRDAGEDEAMLLSAALAYYTLFSLAPLLLVVVAVLGFVFGERAIAGQLHNELERYLGASAAQLVEDLVARTRLSGGGLLATAIGLGGVLLGASTLFNQLKQALNKILDVELARSGVLKSVQDRLLSFGMIFTVGLLLLASMVAETIITSTLDRVQSLLPESDWLLRLAHQAASLLIVTLLFAMIFRFLPDIRLPWRHVWLGAAVTAVLFAVGKYLFGLYLSRGSVASAYGAAGSVVVLLLWAYYSSLILFLGAEFMQAHARIKGGFSRRMPPQAGSRAGETAPS
jgi:membrane protein